MLRIRFKVVAGPLDAATVNDSTESNDYAGRLIAIWHDLDPDENGTPSISPNWWLADPIVESPGCNIGEKVEAWGQTVEQLSVLNRQTEKRPRTSKVLGYKTADGFTKFTNV